MPRFERVEFLHDIKIVKVKYNGKEYKIDPEYYKNALKKINDFEKSINKKRKEQSKLMGLTGAIIIVIPDYEEEIKKETTEILEYYSNKTKNKLPIHIY